MKREFCCADFHRCARFRVFIELGKGQAPANMTPIDQEQADAILQQHAGRQETAEQ